MAGRPDYEAWLAELMPLLDEGDSVLDLGCGCDVPATAILVSPMVNAGAMTATSLVSATDAEDRWRQIL